MLDSTRLRSELEEAIDRFVDAIVELAQSVPAPPPPAPPADELRQQLLDLVAQHPSGVTVNDLARWSGVGLAPLVEQLRELESRQLLRRHERGTAQLPLYLPAPKPAPAEAPQEQPSPESQAPNSEAPASAEPESAEQPAQAASEQPERSDSDAQPEEANDDAEAEPHDDAPDSDEE